MDALPPTQSTHVDGAHPTTEKNLQEFQQLCQRIRNSREMFFGGLQIQMLRARLNGPLTLENRIAGRAWLGRTDPVRRDTGRISRP